MSRFHPVYSTVCHCEIFLGERNSFSFRGVVVKSTFDLVNARPRSFDDVQPDRDANTLVKPWARKARSLGTRSKAWNTIRIESTSIPRVERFVDSILLQQIFSPPFFSAQQFVSSRGDFSRESWIISRHFDCNYSYTSRIVACLST